MAQNKVYQFKIALRGIKPMIWRRIQVPANYTFGQLHVAINHSMGWGGGHLHEFTVLNPKYCEEEFIGLPDEDSPFPNNTRDEDKTKVKPYLAANKKFIYLYDFGDGWEHAVTFEGEFTAQPGIEYPKCIGGKRACPPEDCGGIPGYENLLGVLHKRDALRNDPSAPQLDEDDQCTLDWLDDEFDPEAFHHDDVIFFDDVEA